MKNQPTVYLSIDHTGPRKPLYEEESGNGIWLKLHNNTLWPIVFPVFGVSKEWGDLGMFYDIEFEGEQKSRAITPLPRGYKLGHVSTLFTLPSGRSVVFSIPREHLVKGLKICVNFNYNWEASERGWVRDDEPKHYVYFYGSDVPIER
ncbi:MAG TPA: hypothetical protein VF538_12005 [Pyrinomonadaceae bacterium]